MRPEHKVRAHKEGRIETQELYDQVRASHAMGVCRLKPSLLCLIPKDFDICVSLQFLIQRLLR